MRLYGGRNELTFSSKPSAFLVSSELRAAFLHK